MLSVSHPPCKMRLYLSWRPSSPPPLFMYPCLPPRFGLDQSQVLTADAEPLSCLWALSFLAQFLVLPGVSNPFSPIFLVLQIFSHSFYLRCLNLLGKLRDTETMERYSIRVILTTHPPQQPLTCSPTWPALLEQPVARVLLHRDLEILFLAVLGWIPRFP